MRRQPLNNAELYFARFVDSNNDILIITSYAGRDRDLEEVRWYILEIYDINEYTRVSCAGRGFPPGFSCWPKTKCVIKTL